MVDRLQWHFQSYDQQFSDFNFQSVFFQNVLFESVFFVSVFLQSVPAHTSAKLCKFIFLKQKCVNQSLLTSSCSQNKQLSLLPTSKKW